jgi:hypothetical protein
MSSDELVTRCTNRLCAMAPSWTTTRAHSTRSGVARRAGRQRCSAESGINGNALGANDAACAACAAGEIGRRAFDGSVPPAHSAVIWRWAVKLGKGNWIYGISARSIGACCA